MCVCVCLEIIKQCFSCIYLIFVLYFNITNQYFFASSAGNGLGRWCFLGWGLSWTLWRGRRRNWSCSVSQFRKQLYLWGKLAFKFDHNVNSFINTTCIFLALIIVHWLLVRGWYSHYPIATIPTMQTPSLDAKAAVGMSDQMTDAGQSLQDPCILRETGGHPQSCF